MFYFGVWRSWLARSVRDAEVGGSSPLTPTIILLKLLSSTGVWRSWLARRVWDAEVEGSSPFTPTINSRHLYRFSQL
jgi:hypothetical protein